MEEKEILKKHNEGMTVRVGDKVVPVDHFNEVGVPVIKIRPENIVRVPDGKGGVNVTVNVPCLKVKAKVNTS